MKISRILLCVLAIPALILALFMNTEPALASGSTITVTGTADNASLLTLNANATCDLREAIAAVNTGATVNQCTAGAAPYTIAFNISGVGTHIISLVDGLDISAPVTIDGSTQPGFAGTPLIRLDGGGALAAPLISFFAGSQGSTLKDVMLTGTQYAALQIYTDSITAVGNYFQTDGVNFLGDTSGGNSIGVGIYQGNNNVIGGTTAALRNVISGRAGVWISGGNSNSVLGNYIGVQAGGNASIGSQTHNGVYLDTTISVPSVSGNAIQNNVIGGFGVAGINLQPGANSTTIQGNFIGVGANGSTTIANSFYGIYVYGSAGNTIGGSTTAARNVIAANGTHQVYLSSFISPNLADNNVIQGNFIGIDAAGEAALGAASSNGIDIESGDNNLIGGSSAGQGNVISGMSSSDGVFVNAFATNTRIYGNRIGTNKEGTVALANDTGIRTGAAVAIGNGTAAGENIISGNTTNGVYVYSSTAGTVISYNLIGTNFNGSGFLPNGKGIALNFAAANLGTQITLNWIAHNTYGVYVENNTPTATGSINNCFSGNVTDAVYSSLGYIAPFSGNWWGAANGPSGAGSGSGDPVSTYVDFSSFLATPPTTAACNFQLLKNQDFELDANHDKKPDNWVFANFATATDKRDCTVRKTGACSLKLAGNGTLKSATQTIIRNGTAGEIFHLSLWSKASGIPTGGVYRLQVRFFRGATLLKTINKNFSIGTHGFRQASAAYTAPGSYTKIVFRIILQEPAGTAWFDTAGINWAP